MADVVARLVRRIIEAAGIELLRLYSRVWHRWDCRGREHLPTSGPAIIVANHTSSADPIFLTAALGRPIAFLLAREYYLLPGLRQLAGYVGCIPVWRHGRDVVAACRALRRLRQGCLVGIFPEAGLSNAGRGRLGLWRAGVGWLALRSGCPVVPIWIEGGPQTPDVLPALIRPSRVRLIIGAPLRLVAEPCRFVHRPAIESAAWRIRQAVAALRPG
ncbi:MAG: 1-acyl-sn-glycerol-3-phosphate acyltransferase [Gemmataceae bacterium]|nr:1-acyl-sn-glycerol-3-phosphate acyltransferase [Gemmataceae bacterium]MDW8264781.1 lysophospholipid acyltransferase family protein [Gemmataceae bacterium]